MRVADGVTAAEIIAITETLISGDLILAKAIENADSCSGGPAEAQALLEEANCTFELPESVIESDIRVGMAIRESMLRMAGEDKH